MKKQNLRLQKTWQLSLPEEFIEQLGIQDGSTLTCFLEDNELRIRPETLTQTAPESCSLPGKKTLEIKCFDNMSAILGKSEIAFQSKKAKELTAYLLCRGYGPVKNTILAEALWPDVPIANAMDSLYKAIRYLKKICVNGTLFPITMLHGETYLERQKISCDLEQFESLYRQKNIPGGWKSAVELCRGTLLEESPAEQELSEEQAKTLLTSLEATDLSSNGSSGPFAWDIALGINRGDITKSSANVKITFLSCELTNAALDFKNPKAAVDMKVHGTGVNAELGIDFDRRIIYLKGLLAFLNYNREFNYTLLGF